MRDTETMPLGMQTHRWLPGLLVRFGERIPAPKVWLEQDPGSEPEKTSGCFGASLLYMAQRNLMSVQWSRAGLSTYYGLASSGEMPEFAA